MSADDAFFVPRLPGRGSADPIHVLPANPQKGFDRLTLVGAVAAQMRVEIAALFKRIELCRGDVDRSAATGRFSFRLSPQNPEADVEAAVRAALQADPSTSRASPKACSSRFRLA
jgi:hypothetical protein